MVPSQNVGECIRLLRCLPADHVRGDSAGAADVVHGGASMHPRHPRLLLEALVIPSPLPRYVSRHRQLSPWPTVVDHGGDTPLSRPNILKRQKLVIAILYELWGEKYCL